MRLLELKKDDMIPPATGASITFHQIKRGSGEKPFVIRAGGNISYHALPAKGTSLHTHEFGEMLLVVEGRVAHVVNGETQELPAGSLVFVRPSDEHRFEQIEDEQCELVNFAFQLELLRDLSEYLEDDRFMWRYTGPVTPPVFNLPSSETERLALELLHIISLQHSAKEIARLKVKSILAELFTKHFLKDPKRQGGEHGTPEWLDRICGEMRSERNLKMGLRALQRMAPCTPEHLCKSFRRHLNQTPTEFINELRVGQAAKMLSDGDEKILSIANELGFQSLSRFYHIFRGHYGMSPAKYRSIAKRDDIPI